MFSPSHLKALYPHQVFSVKPSSSLSSMKLKRIVHTVIVSHLCRIIRALSKVKAVVVEILKDNSSIHFPHKKHFSNRRKKIILGSFRLHYNWCSSKSSHVLPVPEPVYEGLSATCRDSGDEDCPYLRWLEEKKVQGEGDNNNNNNNKGANDEHEMNEIDVLAEMFIANCHEKFRLEKQESDRRFQEMLARSM
ncbi:hypothetical protein VNO78_17193 [Psophocarpus tetragonolobus]|uniref:Uncharacterized protein n=1 Tax=Psophocarpus tetragonolobus TaxID=3891 RepID=A0AAN9SI50_PSOTE